MMFKAALALASATLIPSVFGAAVMGRDQIDPQTCVEAEKYIGMSDNFYYSQACGNLELNCLSTLNTTASTDLWSVASCVAGATCSGSDLLTLAQCQNPAVSKANAPHLNYNIYASIVGDCAWQEGGCPITSQNYIDFFYGQLTAIGSTSWPSSAEDVITQYWNPINEWTNTGATIPYTNFDDWLHYAPS
ncbi:hypothetical protein BDZ89DRAFT_1006772 [Hymenopellis radicata]|nr:hypothetical protein BDZ89DRAFT_1006772 [Hymenopellis radicata]